MISPEEVRKLANLARIKLSEQEEKDLAKDMENILDYVKQIQEVSARPAESGAGNAETVGSELKVKNILREDKNPHESGAYTKELLAEALDREDDYVKVKKIL